MSPKARGRTTGTASAIHVMTYGVDVPIILTTPATPVNVLDWFAPPGIPA
jgi:hypothetical protein